MKEIFYLCLWIIISYIFAFYITDYFYQQLPRQIFILTFFFLGTFTSWIATYFSNKLMNQETDLEESAREGLIRTLISFSLKILIAVIFLVLVITQIL